MREYYDLHCHVLPGMDDGCRDAEESLAVIEEQKRQGCCGIAATPHYYAEESIGKFLKRREESRKQLREAAAKAKTALLPMVFGAEAAYHPALVHDEELERLCIGRSRFLLLEMPFSEWSPAVLRDVYTIRSVYNITPVIAHIERYPDASKGKNLEELLHAGAYIQTNAENFGHFGSRRTVTKMIRRGEIHVLGTDSHGIRHRRPNMELAIEKLEKGGLAEDLEILLENNRTVFLEAAEGPSRG